jgi:benzoate/toluate 1,2-dioxygenase beta subunit
MLKEAVTELLLEEADCLDERRWHDWLALYQDDAVYWAPSWDDDDVLIDNPRGEISLIYCGNRDRMGDRVWRIESGLSSSLLRMPRTRHFVTNIRAARTDEGIEALSNVLVLRVRSTEPEPAVVSARRVDLLVETPDGLRLASRLAQLDQVSVRQPNLSFFI